MNDTTQAVLIMFGYFALGVTIMAMISYIVNHQHDSHPELDTEPVLTPRYHNRH